MRIAIFSDIHGNAIALDAVLQDIQAKGGVDEIWVLGDLAAIGHAPIKTLACLASLANASIISGNTDRFLVTGTQPLPTAEQASANPLKMRTYTEVTRTFAWIQGALAVSGWLSWREDIPNTMRHILPDPSLLIYALSG